MEPEDAATTAGGTGLTCGTCHLIFANSQLQRTHHKSEWHQVNVKRKVQQLGPVTQAEYEDTCERNQVNRRAPKRSDVDRETPIIKENDSKMSPEESLEDTSAYDAVSSINLGDCLFCEKACSTVSVEAALQHMSSTHGFFLPDADCCIDVDGLLEYLGAKVGEDFVCLWCDERGKQFRSLDAVRKHMRDAGHCKLRRDGDALVQLQHFYEYGETGVDVDEPDEEVVGLVGGTAADDTDAQAWQLVLPSGASVGHRSLSRYYRQSLDKPKQIGRQRRASNELLSHYRHLGWMGTRGEVARTTAKDVKFMQRVVSKQRQKQGVANSRLFVSKGNRDPDKSPAYVVRTPRTGN